MLTLISGTRTIQDKNVYYVSCNTLIHFKKRRKKLVQGIRSGLIKCVPVGHQVGVIGTLGGSYILVSFSCQSVTLANQDRRYAEEGRQCFHFSVFSCIAVPVIQKQFYLAEFASWSAGILTLQCSHVNLVPCAKSNPFSTFTVF